MAVVGNSGGHGCACKGVRSCLLCESVNDGVVLQMERNRAHSFIYSPNKGMALGIENTDSAGWWIPFPGVCLIQDFVTQEEEKEMVHLMDQEEWKPSQSGRRKQDFGPKVNFKKQKLKVGNFSGLPSFSQRLWHRMKEYAVLEGFLPVEQCNLDYHSDRGSAIDPHFDDSWLWGERLVSLNLLSNTVLTMTTDSVDSIQLMATGEGTQSSAIIDLKPNNFHHTDVPGSSFFDDESQTKLVPCSDVEVAICLPRRSLVVLYGEARFKWKHAIHRKHIKDRRICCTFRELSEEFSPGGKEETLGLTLLQVALGFQGKSA
ncbi:alpha-ketoglutarate-dependent dioxygenase alkB homolog 4 [Spea bombifrons]|uniref:alpha-ketoglutarate-dependent dioxygenase alkB homolog 4 n=1 Tax=Spea bombifrons TaxID=233779 RepID=UPI00234B881B|nr:alpha-ketoglutarate-dependent dioxygenase alkB homolog 4 [Spea bombifrons]